MKLKMELNVVRISVPKKTRKYKVMNYCECNAKVSDQFGKQLCLFEPQIMLC